MAEKLTPQQAEAVNNRGGKLLVSAAAGSGKTKVLVDRLLSYLTDPVAPADLDQFLIITYTKAAAAELRGKIAKKLTERIAEEPENRRLQKQLQRLYLTKISTVHAFCGDILREYAYRLDLAPDFRVADENECIQLRETVMASVLDRAYQSSNDPDFRAFVDSQGLGRDDRLVPEILMKVYDSARCHLDPEQWLERCVQRAEAGALTDASQTVWGEYLIGCLKEKLQLHLEAMEYCCSAAATAGLLKPAALLQETVVQLQRLLECTTWDEILLCKNIDYGRLVISSKFPDRELADRIKEVRNACKADLEKQLEIFADSSNVILRDMTASAAAVRGMVALVRQFGKEYDRAKRIRRVMDFSDLEHRTLDLVLGKSRSAVTAAAREIGSRFREIMVDEYQDSNGVQDAIFSALTDGQGSCFMVGDVKQSIYQFRLADPGIFLDKYDRYPNAEDAHPGEGRKVMLSSNFRSGGDVLQGVNDVFYHCMTKRVGGLDYGEDEALREGIPHVPLGEPEVELWTVDVQEDQYREEAAFVADRIETLLDGTHHVRDGEDLRPIRVDDIAILLRSPGSVGQHFVKALAAKGIRVISGGGEDLLQREEIAVVRSLLQVISNPRQDIPLIAVLASPLFGFTADDLAAFRSADKRCSVYDALLQATHLPKAESFLRLLRQLRREARLQPLAVLMERIFHATGMEGIYGAMEGGKTKKANLQLFYQMVTDYEAGGRRDLEQFLEHLDALQIKGLKTAEQAAAGCVTMMSVHKSKGLEFPVVFVCGLSRSFNRESTRAQVLCHQELGMGLSAVDERNRLRYPTVAKRAIAARITAESLSEEMRVLYVALTRARDRLIMTYAAKHPEKVLRKLALRMDVGHRELLTGSVSCPGDWVLMAALRRTEAGALFALGGKPIHTEVSQIPWLIRVTGAIAEEDVPVEEEEATVEQLPEGTCSRMEKMLAFRYPYEAATRTPSKQTATQKKGRAKDEEAAEYAPEPPKIRRDWRKAAFAGAKSAGKLYGTATHTAMQYIRYEACRDEAAVQREILRLREEGLLTAEQAQMIPCRKLAAFFATPMGQRLRTGENVLREFKFSIFEDADGLDGEKILMQGVVDCALIEDDGITVVDFKTDYVTEETVAAVAERYAPQLQTYARALGRIYQRPVKEAVLYLFGIERFVSIPLQ